MNPFLIPILAPPKLTRSYKCICEKCHEIMCTTKVDTKICVSCLGFIQKEASEAIGKWYKQSRYKRQLTGGLVALKKTHGLKNGVAHNIMKFL